MEFKGAAVIFYMKNYKDRNNMIHSNVILLVYEKGYYNKYDNYYYHIKHAGPIAGKKEKKDKKPYDTIFRECHEEATMKLTKFIPKKHSFLHKKTPIFFGEVPRGFSRKEWNPTQLPTETLGLEWVDLSNIIYAQPTNHYKLFQTQNVDKKKIFISKFAKELVNLLYKNGYFNI